MKKHSTTYQACRDYPAKVAAHLLEQPGENSERSKWEAHAKSCPGCHELLSADQTLLNALRHMPDPAPVMVKAAVMSRVRDRRAERLVRRGDVIWGASAAFAGIIIGLVLVSNDSSFQQISTVPNSDEESASITMTDDFDAFVTELTLSAEE